MAKQASKLTRSMKEFVTRKLGLDANEWMYTENTPIKFVIKNKITGEMRTIDKGLYASITF